MELARMMKRVEMYRAGSRFRRGSRSSISCLPD